MPVEAAWGGWLGRYQCALSRAVKDLQAVEPKIGIEREVSR
jgi:hypothetical protein